MFIRTTFPIGSHLAEKNKENAIFIANREIFKVQINFRSAPKTLFMNRFGRSQERRIARIKLFTNVYDKFFDQSSFDRVNWKKRDFIGNRDIA